MDGNRNHHAEINEEEEFTYQDEKKRVSDFSEEKEKRRNGVRKLTQQPITRPSKNSNLSDNSVKNIFSQVGSPGSLVSQGQTQSSKFVADPSIYRGSKKHLF